MYLRCLSAVALLSASVAFAGTPLRVCADPDNLPLSNRQGQGLENKLADVIGKQLDRPVEYVWWSQRKNFATHSLDQNACDLVLGVPAAMPGVLTTAPYYRSTYVFVSRADKNLGISSLIDPRLARLRIGVNIVGDDYAPPAFALARQGITRNVVGYTLIGGYGEQAPARKIVDAVSRGDVDVAVVWGPLAGYFAQSSPVPLSVTPVTPSTYLGVPFEYDIAAAVRTGNEKLQSEVNQVFTANSEAIRQLVREYRIPQAP